MKQQWIALFFPLSAAGGASEAQSNSKESGNTEPATVTGISAERLRALGLWAYQFTPSVCLHWPLHGRSAAILLEVAPSLTLFGGLHALCTRIENGLTTAGLRCRMGVSVTATSAWWLSQSALQPAIRITDAGNLAAVLPSLPVGVLDHAHAQHLTLQRCGLQRIQQLLQLPRSGLSRRFGAALLRELDCGFGQHAELHTWLQPPPVFHMRREMPFHTLQLHGVLNTAKTLLEPLQWWLQGQHAGTRTLNWTFQHDNRNGLSSLRQVRSAHPLQLADTWLQLLQDELTRQPLPEQAVDITLDVTDLEGLQQQTDTLFPGPQEQQQAWSQLLSRLHARLGHDSLQSPVEIPDPRPEMAHRMSLSGRLTTNPIENNASNRPDCGNRIKATRATPHAEKRLRTASEPADTALPRVQKTGAAPTEKPLRLPRPLWYLNQPQRLGIRHNRPIHNGVLTFLAGPERVEFGWWNSPTTSRDYFIAQDEELRQLWVYRERGQTNEAARWYVQGLYA